MSKGLILSRPQALLLECLSGAIHNRPLDASMFHGVSEQEWKKLDDLAIKQSVPALVADRVLTLPKELLPERGHRLRLAMEIAQVEKGNQRILEALRDTQQDYEQLGLRCVMLKGQTLAHYYPNPSFRSPGDIDVYLYREEDYERANAWAFKQGYPLQGQAVYEQLYWRKGVAVENHKYLAWFSRESYNRKLKQILQPIIDSNAFPQVDLGILQCRTLPLELNAVYIFQHILHHFSYMGIGLRQICDWLVFLGRNVELLDRKIFTDYATQLDLLRPMQYFAHMAVRHLGVEPSIFPFTVPSGKDADEYADLILEDVLRGGNFGFEHFSGKNFLGIWTRRAFMFRKAVLRSLRLGIISPEHIRLTPYVGALTRIRLTLSRLFRGRS